MDADDVEMDQFSADSAAELEVATRALTSALDDYLKLVTGLRGGSRDVQRVFAANDVVRREALRWDGAAGDHTGTVPLGIEDLGEDEDSEETDADDEASDGEPEIGLRDQHRLPVGSRACRTFPLWLREAVPRIVGCSPRSRRRTCGSRSLTMTWVRLCMPWSMSAVSLGTTCLAWSSWAVTGTTSIETGTSR